MIEARADVVIFGGGVAGLWLLAALRARGFSTLLVECDRLGGGQTLAAQGIIHGGLKYGMDGAVTAAAREIKDMPAAWRRALAGDGPVDLHGAQLLSERYYLWLPPGLGGNLGSLVASRAWRARARRLPRSVWPEIFAPGDGNLIEIDEFVLDVGSVVAELARPHGDCIRKVLWPDGIDMDGIAGGDGGAVEIAGRLRLVADRHVFVAGAGNAAIGDRLGCAEIETQRRPLHQLMIKGAPGPLFAHCGRAGAGPRLTITSHRAADGAMVWYVGGGIAEDGIDLGEAELIERGRRALADCLPWIDLGHASFAGYRVDRAEPRQPGRRRPDGPVVRAAGDTLFAWPSKLAFAPRLADMVIDWLAQSGLRPGVHRPADWQGLPAPELGVVPWEVATWR